MRSFFLSPLSRLVDADVGGPRRNSVVGDENHGSLIFPVCMSHAIDQRITRTAGHYNGQIAGSDNVGHLGRRTVGEKVAA